MIALFAAIISAMILSLNRKRTAPEEKHSDNPVCQVLFPKGKPIGQSFSRLQADKRMVRVDSYGEAYEIFLSMCDEEKVVTMSDSGSTNHLYSLGKDNYLCFTDKVQPDNYEVAILWVMSDSINKAGVRNVHFVETIKKK